MNRYKIQVDKIKIIKAIVVFVVFLTALSCVSSTSAKSCQDVTQSDNWSIWRACEMVAQGRSVRFGALWISDASSSSSITDGVTITQSSGQATVYLHGLAICRGGGCIDSVKATYIKLIQSSRTSEICDREYYDYSTWSVFSEVPFSLDRPVLDRYTIFRSGVQPLKLDIGKLKASGLPYEMKNGNRIYNVPIHPYRCMEGFVPSTSSICNCGSDNDPIYVKISVPDETVYSGSSAAGNKSTGFVRSNTTAPIYQVNNCSSTTGCKVTFTHSLRRDMGDKASSYTIKRSSNMSYNSTVKRGVNGGALASTSFNGTGTVRSETLTLYPGMVVCESMSFTTNVNKGQRVTTTACAHAYGDAQPPDPDPDGPNGDQAFVNIKVKNTDASTTYHNYQRTVYAKPGDKLSWLGTYNPILQYTIYLVPNKMQINSGTIHNGNGTNLITLFNSYRGSLPTWKNGFSIQVGRDSNFNSTISNDNYSAGSIVPRNRRKDGATEVLDGDVGRTINGKAITSLNSNNQTTPGQVSFRNNGNANLGNVNTESRYRIANAMVPYNYDTSISVTKDENEPVYAGEKVNIPISYSIVPRPNSATMKKGDKNYATKVGNPKYKIIVYRGGKKSGIASWSGELCAYYGLANNETSCGYSAEGGADEVNNGLSRYIGKAGSLSRSFYVQDLKAGEKVCVAAAFWPANSGSPTNMDANGSKSWRISDSKCYTVAKKPSVQFWGGDVYSRANIVTNISLKRNLNGYTEYSVKSVKGTYAFGSWGELGVVGNGTINGFGSGASMGYGGNNGKILSPNPFSVNSVATAPNPGGGNTANYCDRVPLTIPNSPCNNSKGVGGLSSAVSTTKAANDKESIVSLLASGDNMMNRDHSSVKLDVNRALVGETINGNTTRVISADEDITITENLIYFNDEYLSYEAMPKLVIYSKKNIYIDCGVTQIDALLIADDTVVTCNNIGDVAGINNKNKELDRRIQSTINQRANSNQLFINGAIIAKRLIANRTYGAATGANSIVPAEIVNFDPTLYQFGGSAEANDDTTGRLDVTTMHEVAPRL